MDSPTLTWLGQSGFLLRAPSLALACDLYLSDYCKKRSKLDHTRLMPVPLKPESLDFLDHYLITHAHIDHFDPETVGPAMKANSKAVFHCPPSGRKVIDEFFKGEESRFKIWRSGKLEALAPGVSMVALPAAHEELERDASGEYVCFSYLLLLEKERKAVFFAGDCVPFEGQARMIGGFVPEGFDLVMVLPVNGRDAARAKLGFKGNFTVDEAISLALSCGASLLVPCHFGMFALNDLKEPLSVEGFKLRGVRAAVPEINKQIKL